MFACDVLVPDIRMRSLQCLDFPVSSRGWGNLSFCWLPHLFYSTSIYCAPTLSGPAGIFCRGDSGGDHRFFLYTNIQVYLLLLCFQVHRNAYCCPFDVFKSFGSGGHHQIHQRASEKSLNLVFSCENGGAPCSRECIMFAFEGSTGNPESVIPEFL